MKLTKLRCTRCHKVFFRNRGRVNEAKKFGWKPHCSLPCQFRSRIKRKIFRCSNSGCQNIFSRTPNEIRSENLYCSSSCAAKVNNQKYPKHLAPQKECLHCKKFFKGLSKKIYCSVVCKFAGQIISGKEVISKIKEFHKRCGRIPLKREFPHYNAARNRFGNWNNAIKAAGFEPNPALFSNRQIAKDGHICDSIAEMIIDDWLHDNDIIHDRNVHYPGSLYTTDFVVNDKFIEFFGLAGEIAAYDKIIAAKQKLAQKYNIPLIKIYPKDLYAKGKIDTILKNVLTTK